MVESYLLDVIIAYILDLIFGDPLWMPHPVRLIGWLIKKTEGFMRPRIEKSRGKASQASLELIAGAMMTLFVTAAIFALVLIILKLAFWFNNTLFHILNIYFIYSALAAKCLADEAEKVHKELKEHNISEARYRLSMLVGRETSRLDDKEIIRGVVETTAENTVDGVISPLFYALIGSLFGLGAPLVYAFKAISTMDSMVGYMNEKYLNFGKVSAKTDDFANYLPARISGLIIPLGALFCGLDPARSLQIMLRDRRNHKSPNCAYPEAAVAGALGVRIGGNNIYFGKVMEKPTIGDPAKELEASDIIRCIWLMYISSTIALILGILLAKLIKEYLI